MHAWYALETQCNGRIVTRGREAVGTGVEGVGGGGGGGSGDDGDG